MLGRGLFFRASNLVTNSRILINNRIFPSISLQPQVARPKSYDERLRDVQIPERPKRPLSAYFRFLRDQRSNIVQQNPDLKVTDVSKKCAESWREADIEVKKTYEAEYKAELETYAKQVVEYTSKLSPAQKEFIKNLNQARRETKHKREIKKRNREADKPKLPMGAYMRYVIEQHELTGKPFKELLMEMKGTWGNLSESQKSKYIEITVEARKQYEKDLLVWEEKMIQEGNEELVRYKTLLEKRPALSRERRKKSFAENALKDIQKIALDKKDTEKIRQTKKKTETVESNKKQPLAKKGDTE